MIISCPQPTGSSIKPPLPHESKNRPRSREEDSKQGIESSGPMSHQPTSNFIDQDENRAHIINRVRIITNTVHADKYFLAIHLENVKNIK